jgi:hypothetical protein
MANELDRVLESFVERAEFGRLHWAIALGGSHPADDQLAPHLCSADGALLLIGVRDGAVSSHVELLEVPEFRYREQLLADQLEVDGSTLTVPRGKAETVLRAIARAMLLRHFPRPPGEAPRTLPRSPFIEQARDEEADWLVGWLAPSERLFALLATDERRAMDSSILGAVDAPLRYLLTSDRHGLVAISRAGDVRFEALPRRSLRVTKAIGRDTVHCGERGWKTTLANESKFAEIAELPALETGERARAMARALWGTRKRPPPERIEYMREILSSLDQGPLSTLIRVLVLDAPSPGAPPPDELEAAMEELALTEDGANQLARWWARWQIDDAYAEPLIVAARELGATREALFSRLHVELRERSRDDEPALERAERDLALADHLIALDRQADARVVLAEALKVLPSPSVCELLPADALSGLPRLRVALLERIVSAAEAAEILERTRELFALEPLIPQRSEALARVAGHEDGAAGLRRRAQRVLDLLTSAGELAAPDSDEMVVHPKALSERLLEEHLRHPEARADGLLGRLQTLLAKASAPDASALKAYCERAHLSRHPRLEEAVSDAAMLLGVPSIETFISRGEKGIGLRAYEAKVPFLLIGGDHLDPSADAYLDPIALRFAAGAELAHLRFKHSRVTPDEVVAGGIEIGIQGLNLLLAATPFLKTVYQSPVGRMLDRLGSPVIDRVKGRFEAGDEEPAIGKDSSELIAAHRVMQYTADRAGLLSCRSPEAAVRAILATHPAHLVQASLARRHPLVDVLARPADAEEQERARNLSLRIAALLAFALSEDYERLVTAAYPAN